MLKKGRIELPDLKEGEMLVKVRAAGAIPVDTVIRQGYLQIYDSTFFPNNSGLGARRNSEG